MNEIETKILEVDVASIREKILALGAKPTGSGRLFVDWYKMPHHEKRNEPWYLRIRNTYDGGYELTWKPKEETKDGIRTVREIHFHLTDHEKMRELLDVFGLVSYAHQERDRESFQYGAVRFDIDTFPGIPSFLEIEAPSQEEVASMIHKLELEKHERFPTGERRLVEEKYGLDWYAMHF